MKKDQVYLFIESWTFTGLKLVEKIDPGLFVEPWFLQRQRMVNPRLLTKTVRNPEKRLGQEEGGDRVNHGVPETKIPSVICEFDHVRFNKNDVQFLINTLLCVYYKGVFLENFAITLIKKHPPLHIN